MLARLRRVLRLLGDPRVPRLPRLAVVLAAVYLLSPVDFLPDWAPPVVGWIDDLTLVWLSLRWLVKRDPDSITPARITAPTGASPRA
jgi:uncharacterized membrane protein YkvA (DUF1232 family)